MHDTNQASNQAQQAVTALPDNLFEQLDNDIARAGGEFKMPEEFEHAIGRTMFDLATSEDQTVTVLLPSEHIGVVPSQSLVRIRSVSDQRTYLGIVVKGPFAEPDGLRGDAPIVITTAVRGGIFIPRYHGRVQVELIGELINDVLMPPRFRPLPNSPVFVLDSEATSGTLKLEGDIVLGVPVGYEAIQAAISSENKTILPRHIGILGTTGGGKSTTVSGLVAHFQKSAISTVLIDTEGEYTEIYQPTNDRTMQAALKERNQQPHGVDNVHVYHLVGRQTTCPDPARVTPFSLHFSKLSPYLVMEVLDLNEAQQQRYQKAYDITKQVLRALKIFPANPDDLNALLELDELETGYPKLTVSHIYDIVQACAHLAANMAVEEIHFRTELFRQNRDQVLTSIGNKKELTHPGSWRIIQGRLSQLLRLNIFDNPKTKPLDYTALTKSGRVSIIDLSDTDSPQIKNLVIAELLRGLQAAQNDNYQQADQSTLLHRLMIIIEEAHEFLSAERIKQMPILFEQVARIARRGRKRWLGMVFVTQLPQHLPDEVLGLINNFILHKIGDANVISKLKRSLGGVDASLWNRLPNLAPGQALVSMTSFSRPLLVNIDPTPCKLRMVD